ncbi:hypothetical protein EDD86DRAFT_208471 [Gorgonomyces haynaldii]|nr:hypothetical protein EDD86DRAFT_208471 [Gorgonomyces haynaldii]
MSDNEVSTSPVPLTIHLRVGDPGVSKKKDKRITDIYPDSVINTEFTPGESTLSSIRDSIETQLRDLLEAEMLELHPNGVFMKRAKSHGPLEHALLDEDNVDGEIADAATLDDGSKHLFAYFKDNAPPKPKVVERKEPTSASKRKREDPTSQKKSAGKKRVSEANELPKKSPIKKSRKSDTALLELDTEVEVELPVSKSKKKAAAEDSELVSITIKIDPNELRRVLGIPSFYVQPDTQGSAKKKGRK